MNNVTTVLPVTFLPSSVALKRTEQDHDLEPPSGKGEGSLYVP